jgi:hypothetical protein
MGAMIPGRHAFTGTGQEKGWAHILSLAGLHSTREAEGLLDLIVGLEAGLPPSAEEAAT